MSFKVGDIVRLIDQMKYNGHWTGPMEIKALTHLIGNRWVDVEHPTMGAGSLPEVVLELVPVPAPAPKFHPGDIVRLAPPIHQSITYNSSMKVVGHTISSGKLMVECIHPINGLLFYSEEMLELVLPQPLQSGITIQQQGWHLQQLKCTPIAINDASRTVPIIYGKQKGCECGAEASGYTSHSSWCPKHER